MLNSFSPWPFYDSYEREAVLSVLSSGKVNFWTGDQGREFEREYAAYTGRKHAIAVANGTLALELALYALDIGPGEEVITTARTFIASASAIVMRGAKPVVVDVDRVSQNMTADTIREAVTSKTKALICVHLAGWPCDMDPILNLARQHDLKVIEDCAQAHGARYKGKPVGSLGVMGAFSFCQDKIMTTGGEGGMLVLDDESLWKKAWAYKDHGKSWDEVYEREHPPGFRWLHESFGTNWRLTEMQSAIGRVQLKKLDSWVDKRRSNAAKLITCFKEIPLLRVPEPPDHIYHSYYKFFAFIRPERLKSGWDRDQIMDAIVNRGVPCFTGFCPEIYLEKAFARAGYGPKHRLPVAKELGETSLMFLVHPTLTPQEIDRTCEVVSSVCTQATA